MANIPANLLTFLRCVLSLPKGESGLPVPANGDAPAAAGGRQHCRLCGEPRWSGGLCREHALEKAAWLERRLELRN